ncbi:chorismate mutase 2-like [Phalaenopsis equestris]|uniref:chorismate mutase 2-like n=1 Tax=Phalaenopsis equestris TaxID=78828 RepID=UPI0009E3D554|nr:chorismate mutase 2-like [Phalaenopsis equestris]
MPLLLPYSLSPMASMTHSSPLLIFLYSLFSLGFSSFWCCATLASLTIDSLRASLEQQEDFIVISLIERARYPYNSIAYHPSILGNHNCSFLELFVRETEALEARFGRYQNPEELPFFPVYAQPRLAPPHKFPNFLYPPAASTNVSKIIWDMYLNDLLPLFTTKADDGNYQQIAASDLICLQALSKRIHYGRYVAEIKFRDSPHDYIPAIKAKDRETLLTLLTFTSVEEAVVKRVFKKAEIFGQIVNLGNNNVTGDKSKGNEIKYKVDPYVASKLYQEWVIPFTKQVEVDYLLNRLN